MSDTAEVQETTAQTASGQDAQGGDVFTRDYVEKLRQEAASYRTQLREHEQLLAKQAETQKQAEEERLAKQAEWQTLAEQRAKEIEQYKPFKDKWDAMVAQTAVRNQARIDAVPESMRTLLPDYDDPMKLSAWLDANEATITQPKTAPKLDGGAGAGSRNGSGQQLTDAEIREKAAVYGVSPAAMRQVLGIQ